MANQSSVIDIQVNDEQFQNYLASVREYRELLREAGADLQGTLDGISEGGEERAKAVDAEAKSRKELVATARDANFEESKGIDVQNKQNLRIKDRIRLLIDAGRHQRDNISAAMKFAKSPLGKLGIAGAAAAGVMKALNMASELAQQGMDLRMQTRISGLDSGHYTAWQRNLEPYDPSGAMFQHAVEATRDGAEAARLQAIGVDTSSGDVNKILASLVTALREFRNSHQGPAEQQVFEGMGLGDLRISGDILGRAGEREVAAIPRNVERDARNDYVSDSVLGSHQEASLNVGRRHDEWTATKLNTLAPVVENMTKEAEQAQEKLDDLAIAATKAAGALDKMTGGHGLLAGGIAAAVGPSILKVLGKASIKLGGEVLGGAAGTLAAGGIGDAAGTLASGALRVAGPIGVAISALTPSELGADDTINPSQRDRQNVRLVHSGQEQENPQSNPPSTQIARPRQPSEDDQHHTPSVQLMHPENRSTTNDHHDPSSIRLVYSSQDSNPADVGSDNIRTRPQQLNEPTTTPSNDNRIGAEPPLDMNRLAGAVAMVESHGDPYATSRMGAQGLMQLMPAVQRERGVTNPYDPRQSWESGKGMLKSLLRHYDGNQEKSLAAYNWGIGNLDRDIRKLGDGWRRGLPRETANYLMKVQRNYQNNTTIRIENYSGQDLSVAARQGSVL